MRRQSKRTLGPKLAATLEEIRGKCVCAYVHSEHFCDCKYGANRIGERAESGNGCPEMRDAIHVLSRLSDEEIERVRKRKIKR